MITLDVLDDGERIRHGFFTRRGGCSSGLYDSLNCGFGSGDSSDNVARNRATAMQCLGVPPDRLVTCRQIHSATVVAVGRPWRQDRAPRADGLVTACPGIALGILTADCAPILLQDSAARVIGAAHGGWRGVLGGILETTIEQMERLGAERARIHAGIGPCIAHCSYEVGPEFPQPFLTGDPTSARYFAPAQRVGHFMFDLPGYVAHRLHRAGIAAVQSVGGDTVGEDRRFFSYRRACLRGEPAYGRSLSVIVIES